MNDGRVAYQRVLKSFCNVTKQIGIHLTSDSGIQYEVEIPFWILNIRLLTVQNYLQNMAFKRVILPVFTKRVELPDPANMLYYDFFQHF